MKRNLIFNDIKRNKNIKLKYLLKDQRTFKFIISVLILLVLFRFVDFNLLLNSLKNINGLFLLVLLLIPINILVRAWRFMIILNKDKKLISIKDSFYLNLAGITMNLFLPASSGDIAKSYYGYKWHGIKEEMLSSSILDKFMALFSIFVLGCIMSIFLKFYELTIFSLMMAILLAIIIFYPKIMPWNALNRFLSTFLKIRLDEEKLAVSFAVSNKLKIFIFLISIIAWLLAYFQFYLLCLSFSVNIEFIYVIAIAPLINLSLLFPLTVNGLGSGEAMIVYLFSLINIAPTLSIAISLLSQVINAIIPGLIGLLIIIRK